MSLSLAEQFQRESEAHAIHAELVFDVAYELAYGSAIESSYAVTGSMAAGPVAPRQLHSPASAVDNGHALGGEGEVVGTDAKERSSAGELRLQLVVVLHEVEVAVVVVTAAHLQL